MKYSQERKQAVLAKLAPPHQRTVEDVAAIASFYRHSFNQRNPVACNTPDPVRSERTRAGRHITAISK